ncbi:MAG: hypothetical protein K0S70_4976, partial [Microbacterium sp.]|nr:hypothetical protein [Microbacterium sp.]
MVSRRTGLLALPGLALLLAGFLIPS